MSDVDAGTVSRYRVLAAVLGACLCLIAKPAAALDGIMLSAGDGSDHVDLMRVSAYWQWPHRWFQRGNWLLTGIWDAGLSRWDNEIKVRRAYPENKRATHEIRVVSLTPVFRWQSATPIAQALVPFLEAGVGAAILSNRRLASKGVEPRRFGIRFQFETRIGLGMCFGKQQQFEFSLRKYHYSNADIHRNNQGMDLHVLSYGWWF